MKTIFLYGAPGVGKLTVANELAKVAGFSVLHNHLLNDLVESVLDWGTAEFWDTVRTYRLDLMERAAKAKRKGIILTWVYGKPFDDVALGKIVRQARKHNGKILFVHLVCDQKELFKRIKHPSRKAFGKVKSSKTLREIMQRRDIFSDVPHKPNFVIDNSKISPRKAALLIQKHYSL